ncbi:hypothetical protein [Lysinibacillus sp. 54212]|uniref:hypothetical protein n=1 Tax=Lysinibacillus sp. 54212 TaxID=3119829 RepID=UPI002FCA75C9
MKRYGLLLLILFLAACGGIEKDVGSSIPDKTKVENISAQEVEESPFTLRLVSDKEQYKVGEKLSIRAELIFEGDKESITIGHAASWIWLSTTNFTKNYRFGAFMNEPYIRTTMTKGEAIIQPYHFSGVTYQESMGGNPYSEEELKEMASDHFPIGQYEINGRTDFEIEGQSGRKYQLEARVIFEVVE